MNPIQPSSVHQSAVDECDGRDSWLAFPPPQITGGAGFVGSHLTDKLMMDGHEVTVVDNFFTGRKRNVEHWIGHENFELINHDVVEPLYIEGEERWHRVVVHSFHCSFLLLWFADVKCQLVRGVCCSRINMTRTLMG